MEYMIAIYLLLMAATAAGPGTCRTQVCTVQGNYEYRQAYIQQGILPGSEKANATKNRFSAQGN